MKFLFTIVFLLSCAGCATPLAEINYRGVLPTSQNDAFKAADEFAVALEKESDLRITDRTIPSGLARLDSSASVNLRTPTSSKVWVIVIAYIPERMIVVRIAGDIDSPLVKDYAAAFERVHARLYPGTDFARFQRYSGIFGP